MSLRLILLIGFVLVVPNSLVTPAQGDDVTRAFVGAKIIPIGSPEIEKGVLIVRGGTILAVGKEGEVAIPPGSKKISAKGKIIMPGLICTHSHIGGPRAADSSHPIQPGVRVYDSLNIHDSGFRRALAGGLTTLNIMPGSGHLISGQTIYVKLRFDKDRRPRQIDDLFIRNRQGKPVGGLKMANGTNSQDDPPFPGTRGKSAFLVRQQFIKAREYQVKRSQAKNGEVPRDLHLETLVEVMQGKRVVHHHTHRHDDIMTVLRLSREFGFPVVLHHVSDGWKVAKEIAAAKAPCSVILIDSPGGKLEAKELRLETGKILEDAGVRVAFHTDDLITDSRVFFRMAALAVRAGMSRKLALESLTIAGAEMLTLEDRIGSLAKGKDADFIILNGDPFSVYTKVEQTWVEGKKVFDRSNPKDRLYAVGGFGAGHDQSPVYCCYGKQK